MRGVTVKDIKQFLSMVGYCVQLSWQASPFYTAVRLVTQLIGVLLPLLLAYLSKLFINTIAPQDGFLEFSKIFYAAAGLLIAISVCKLAGSLCDKISQYVQSMHYELTTHTINLQIIERTASMDIQYFDSPDYQNTLQIIYQDMYSLPGLVWQIFSCCGACISAVGAFAMITRIHWLYALLILAATIPVAVAEQKHTRMLYFWRRDHMHYERQRSYLQNVAADRRCASDVRLFHMKELLVERYKALWEGLFLPRRKMTRRKTVAAALTGCFPEICAGGILIALTYNTVNGRGSVGDYVLYSSLLAQLIGALYVAVQSAMSIYEDKLKIDTLHRFEQYENAIQDGTLPLAGPLKIEFEDVSFRYPNTEKWTLRHISFVLHPSEKTCLIGINGAGKSTLVKLMLRFYDVTEGRILVNDRDIKEYCIEHLRQQFSALFQEIGNYAMTIRENVALSEGGIRHGSQSIDEKRIYEALEAANGLDIPAANGLDHQVTKLFAEDGLELSGGQQQKLALARTLYRKCHLLILDEPAASLDPETEQHLFENMRAAWKGKSLLFISHHFATVHLADKILLLENGHIAEQGSHAELMRHNGRYAQLYRMQADRFQHPEKPQAI